MYPEIPLPPKPILTRWGTWLEAVEYYAEHIDSINNVLLALDSEDAVSIDTAKTVTCDISVKNDLAHIQHTFSCIIKTLKSLQNRHLSLSESFEIINSTVEQLNRGRGKVADAVRAKVDTVLSKNPGYEELQKVVAVMSGESTVKINLDLSPADIVKLNYVPVTSCDVERSFSQYKSILRDNRRRFTFQHLKEMFVTYCYDQQIGYLLRRHLYTSYIDFAKQLLTDCNLSTRLAEIPVRFLEPVYGGDYLDFINFAAPGVILTSPKTVCNLISDTNKGITQEANKPGNNWSGFVRGGPSISHVACVSSEKPRLKRIRPVCTVVQQEEVESIPASSYECTMVHCVLCGIIFFLSLALTAAAMILEAKEGLMERALVLGE
ncbi:hypothetical protein ANN_13020 [Periplaneta americana]|uniref:Uncharacterized protein n=1 Tax=Periplaneta americana TaxID=6978 RepID=A0ABQ8TKY3_PERAM|nr:hypothetical protein ANN_13020 [Periplaneta americana]